MNAVAYHSAIVESFAERYRQSPAFQERWAVWTHLLDRYVRPGDYVVDAGCGTGVFSFYAAETKAAHVLGLDGSAEMIRHCEAERQRRAVASVRFAEATLPLRATTFGPADVVLASSVLEYVADADATLRSFYELLRPGGRLLVSMPNGASAYRRLERLWFWLTGRPPYLRYVRHYARPDRPGWLLERGFRPLETVCYGGKTPLSAVLRPVCHLFNSPNGAPLFVVVCQKP